MAYSTTAAARDGVSRDGKLSSVKIKTGQVICKGYPIVTKVADGLGYMPYAAAGQSAGDKFAGMAYESMTSAADTDECRVDIERRVWEFDATGLAQTDIYKTAYHDGGTDGTPKKITLTAGHAVPLGKIVKVLSATKCLVLVEAGGVAI